MQTSVRDTICMSFIYSEDDNILVFDGGYPDECEHLYEQIKKVGTTVHTWFITHPHDDHMGALVRLMEKYGDEIKIQNLCYNFIPEHLMEEHAMHDAINSIPLMRRLYKIIEKYNINVITAKAGDVYNIGKSKIHVLREPDLSITREIFNNSSLVLRLDTNGKRILFMGDLTVEGGEEILKNSPPDELKCDYVQMAHHGQGGVEKNVYEVISADYCLWCTPSWLWDNVGENGYDTNIFKTIIVRGWMSEIRAKKHYQNTFGDVIIEI